MTGVCHFQDSASVYLRHTCDCRTDTYSSTFLNVGLRILIKPLAVILGWDCASNLNNLEMVPGNGLGKTK